MGHTPLRSRMPTGGGRTGQQLLYRQDEDKLELEGQAWSLDADGTMCRLASEAKRISLAYLFDPSLDFEFETGSGARIRTVNLAVNSLTRRISDGPRTSLPGPSRTRSSGPRSPLVPICPFPDPGIRHQSAISRSPSVDHLQSNKPESLDLSGATLIPSSPPMVTAR